MDSMFSILGASLLLFIAGGTIVALLSSGIVVTFVSLNEYLKTRHR
jgi:hypothetical protein